MSVRRVLAWFELPRERSKAVQTLPLVAAALAGLVCWLLVTGRMEGGSAFAFGVALASVTVIVLATAAAAYDLAGRSVRRLALTPFALAAITWIILFVLRPLELYIWPEHAAISLAQLGFELADLTRGVALAGLGCAAFSAAYLLALRSAHTASSRGPTGSFSLSGRRAALVLGAGTVLWLLLFLRQGGPSALLHSPASIRTNQGASFYAFVGVWMVQGTALYSLAAVLTGGGRTAKRVLWASVALSLLASAALQLRGLLAVAVLAAAAIYILVRGVTRRTAAVGAVAILLGGAAFVVAQQVRAYSTMVSTSEAVSLTVRTPPHLMLVSDLSTYENLVAMEILVPESIAYLDGETLVAIPQALVPRAIWPDKPETIDARVGAYFYPGVGVGIPITMQGELFWNGGLVVLLLGSLVLGGAFGALARAGLHVRVGAALVLYAAVFPFTHAALTRSLASATQNVAFVLLGVGLAIVVLDRRSTQALVARLRAAPGLALAPLRRARLGGGP